MSNPLSMFRKHQYIFLVVFGVMLMVAFIVLPPLDDYLRTSRGPGGSGDTVVVRWRGGQLRESEVQRLRDMHRMAVSYLYAVVGETQRREGTPRGVNQDRFGQVVDPGIPSNMSDEHLVHTHLLASKGEAMGMVVSDEAIAEFLEQLSDETIQAQEMSGIFKEALGGTYSIQQLLNQLRIELMAQRVRSMAEAGLYVAPYGTVPPVQAWDYFKRLNRRAKIEAVALDVKDYVDQVASPTEAQLKTLYDEGKNRFSYLQSPEPGFHVRRKAAFQFVRVDFNKFLEEEKEKITITDEAIEKHYEENKAVRYKVLDLPDAPDDSDAPATEGEKPADSDGAPAPPKDDAAPQPPAESPTPELKPDAPKPDAPKPDAPKPDAPKPDAPKPDAPKPDAPKPEPAKTDAPKTDPPTSAPPADAPKAEAATPDAPKPDAPKPDAPKPDAPKTDASAPDAAPSAPEGAGRRQMPREYFVSLQEDANQPPADSPAPAPADPAPAPATPAAPTTEPSADTPPSEAPQSPEPAANSPQPKEAQPEPPKPDAPKPESPEPEAPKPADSPAPKAESAPATTPPATTETTDPESAGTPEPPVPAASSSSTPPSEEAPEKIRPLDDELRQEIREELTEIEARKPAQERVDKAIAELRSEVTRLGREKRKALRSENPEDDEVEPAGPVDVSSIAGQHGLTVGQIPLVDALEINGSEDGEKPGYELGESFNMQFVSWPPTRQNFTDIAFAENTRRYSPSTISGSESGVQFLYWKIDGEEPYVPTFAEARPDVEAAWKRIEARKIAENEAKKIADALNKANQTLPEKFGDSDQPVIEPPDFSWLTTGFNPGGAGTPTLSDVEGVENAGQDFMKEVFSLKVGEVGTTNDMPKSKVYLVRLVSDSPPEDLLKQLFLTSGDSPEVQYVAYVENLSLLRAWIENLETEMDVKWQRDPIEAT